MGFNVDFGSFGTIAGLGGVGVLVRCVSVSIASESVRSRAHEWVGE